MKRNVQKALTALRAVMQRHGISATIIPQADPHMSEYISDHWQARRMLSGFTGSAGDLVVTLDKAMLWTDSRYFIQAEQQLDGTEISLMKDGLRCTPPIGFWLCDNLKQGERVGIDGMMFSVAAAQALQMELNAGGLALATDFSPLAEIWPDRPALPTGKVFVHDAKYTGREASEKIADILKAAESCGADATFISALDEIAWTLNIRSNDVSYNPVVTSFLYLSPAKSVLFIDPAKVTPEIADYFSGQGITTQPYDAVKEFLASLPDNTRVLVDPARNSAGIVDALGSKVIESQSPVLMLKACKNDVQIEGERSSMVRDGVAMVKSLCEITSRIKSGDTLTEMSVAEILRRHRAEGELFFDESFGTIAGYGPHGAIVHYEATPESDATLRPEGLLLIDSGAQYLDGTTDITRTICLGSPTRQEIRDFTLVMKGHIALASMIFPAGTTGHQLDAIARQFLWKEGLSYLHGTGHGVGHFLNVHEGPHSIRLNHVHTPLTPGMITSNEPGLYREGIHGIRCENLVLTTEAMTTDFGTFYRFETLTLCPFERRLFDITIMTPQEIEWINQYHREVARQLLPHLDGEVKTWLENATKPL